jgi:hypothetical protein
MLLNRLVITVLVQSRLVQSCPVLSSLGQSRKKSCAAIVSDNGCKYAKNYSNVMNNILNAVDRSSRPSDLWHTRGWAIATFSSYDYVHCILKRAKIDEKWPGNSSKWGFVVLKFVPFRYLFDPQHGMVMQQGYGFENCYCIVMISCNQISCFF